VEKYPAPVMRYGARGEYEPLVASEQVQEAVIVNELKIMLADSEYIPGKVAHILHEVGCLLHEAATQSAVST
jgi:hypothetical protein